jgi:polar amino acid transport system substrate-binding protein
MTPATLTPGILRVGSAIPDPPFELMRDGEPTGLDIELMRAVCDEIGLTWQLCRYAGEDFEGIYDALDRGMWDCVASGATITPAREQKADFCTPYLVSDQSLVCNSVRTPDLRSVHDLKGRTIAVQRGNTSEPVVERLKAQGAVADVRLYPYDGILTMLDDLEAGRIDAIMKLGPVMHWLTRDRPHLRVVQERITVEKIAVSVRRGNDGLRTALEEAQQRLVANGTLAQLTMTWVGS